uniref:Major facilitator superfamily (MFS) profile domain-containing protein n=1 Tax=Plectus sambesii TaxID=2011161 RepID=A0A914UI21_9BILA
MNYPELQPHGRLIFATAAHSIFGIYADIQSIALNYLEVPLKPFLNQSFYQHYGVALDPEGFSWLWSVTAACNSFGILFTALFVRSLMEGLGRKTTCMILRPFIGIVAAALMVASKPFNSFEMFAAGHFLAGAGYTLKGVILVYLAECSPDKFRGLITLTAGSLIYFLAMLLATTLSLPVIAGNDEFWILLPAVSAIFALLHFCASFFLPPSPKHLYITKRAIYEARKAIKFYHGDRVDEDHILHEYDHEDRLASSHRAISLREMLTTAHLRTPLLLCIVASVAPSFSALNIRGQYSASMLSSYGVPNDILMLAMMGINLLPSPFCLLAPWLIERAGRRPLFLTCISLCLLEVGLLFTTQIVLDQNSGESSRTTIFLGLAGFLAGSFASVIGIVTIACILVSELCPQATRATASQAIVIAPVILSLITVFLYPPAILNIGAYTFVPLLVMELLVMLVMYLFMPETRNLPVDVIVRKMMPRRGSIFLEDTVVPEDPFTTSYGSF